MTRVSFAVLATLALLVPSASGALSFPFSNLYVFGDSIVDAGNTQLAAGGPGSPNDPTPASAGYFQGRFTNGLTPADIVNQEIEGVISTPSLLGGDNFAFGGARARDNSLAPPPLTPDALPDFESQVAQFTGANLGVADPNALYLINVGGNDVFDALTLFSIGQNTQPIFDDAVNAITNGILSLQGIGAQHILFVGIADVGAPPAANGVEGIARFFSNVLNNQIQNALPAGVEYFDTVSLVDEVLGDPTLFGLPAGIQTEISCLNSGAADPSGPPTCTDYAFFDDVHPTAQLLGILGDELLVTVPEPGTGLMLGLGLIGLAARRRAAA